MKTKLRILIAEDHEIVRRGMRPLIDSHPGWEICAEASDGREAVDLALKHKPDVAVIDVGLPRLNGVEATRQIKRELPETEVLGFTGIDREDIVHELFAVGALGCVLKTDAEEHLLPAIEALAKHEPYLRSHTGQIVFTSYLRSGAKTPPPVGGKLSPREREVLQLVAEGRSNKDIATLLGTSVKTVETQRSAVMRKLGFKNMSDLVRYAVRHQLVQP
ncbi:MAG: response regulator transcription factor [Chthoniobacteraceae bacterium]